MKLRSVSLKQRAEEAMEILERCAGSGDRFKVRGPSYETILGAPTSNPGRAFGATVTLYEPTWGDALVNICVSRFGKPRVTFTSSSSAGIADKVARNLTVHGVYLGTVTSTHVPNWYD